ncbi:hypothetical protein ACH5RR_040086 [Cinchona calisaya]|uniref:Sugar phosphate transporter domain-containing protein n=1 Tax=Cinchona calisaya TaxID=153742 RepID=A0ABD2XRH1_9GENT
MASNRPILPVVGTETPSKVEEKIFKGSSMTKRGAYAYIAYMTCAVLLVLFNKAALSSYNFPCANVITLCQMISSCCFLYVLRRRKLISFHAGESLTGADNFNSTVPLRKLIDTTPVAMTYLIYMLISMESVRGVNVPMYTTLRRMTVVFTMIVEYFLVRQKYTRPIFGSVALIVLGAFIAGARDLSFEFYGYLLVFLSNITTAVYLATIARIGKSSGLNSFGLMWCNGIICGPLLLVWTYIQGDLKMTMNFSYLLSPGFLVVVLVSCILAFLLNYSVFLNTTLNSALTQTICGNLKDLFTITLGWIIFGGLPFDLLNIIGQLVGFLGSDGWLILEQYSAIKIPSDAATKKSFRNELRKGRNLKIFSCKMMPADVLMKQITKEIQLDVCSWRRIPKTNENWEISLIGILLIYLLAGLDAICIP